MGVLYGRYDLLDRLTAYKVRPAPKDPPGKFETGTGNFEGMCGVLGALEYIEWVGETFGAEHAERYAADYTGRRLRFKLGMSAIRSYEFELSHTLLDILAETPGVTIYGITDTKQLEERVPTCAFTLKGKTPRQVAEEFGRSQYIRVGWELLCPGGHRAPWFGRQRRHGACGSGTLQYS
jgi:selenocysteine lyase/cysteine desulfurase